MKMFEYEQQIKHLKKPLDEIKKTLENKGVLYAGIIHDKDDAEPHVHIMVKLNSDMTVDNVAKWFKDYNEHINIKKTRWNNKLSYLVHRTENASNKYQYSPDEVFANFDYVKELKNIENQIEKHKKIEDYIEMIQNGDIREYNLTDFIDAHIFALHKVKILNALEWYRRKVMTDKDRNINVMLFSGETGTGKTTFAKTFCKNAKKSFCVSSSSNDPMQDYKGEDVLILDDLRDSTFKYSDLLKILDNHTNSTVQSRYNNKAFIGDTIIITSIDGIKSWYDSKTDEDLKQLWRRIPQWYAFTKEYINLWVYNEKLGDYENIKRLPNIIQMEVKTLNNAVVSTLENLGYNLTDDEKKIFLNNPNNDKTLGDVLKEGEYFD